jgi:hypothetical protein
MPVVPRTPSLTQRTFTLTPSKYTQSYSSGTFNERQFIKKDVYDKFIDIFFESSIKIQMVLLTRIKTYLNHPVYEHLLNTMDRNNAHHVMGYLRSQRHTDLHMILENICGSDRPTEADFFKEVMGL